jgi:hypothetical protein
MHSMRARASIFREMVLEKIMWNLGCNILYWNVSILSCFPPSPLYHYSRTLPLCEKRGLLLEIEALGGNIMNTKKVTSREAKRHIFICV